MIFDNDTMLKYDIMFDMHSQHLKELNRTNPLGQSGELALQYGKLIHELWLNTSSTYGVSTWDFKQVLTKFAKQVRYGSGGDVRCGGGVRMMDRAMIWRAM